MADDGLRSRDELPEGRSLRASRTSSEGDAESPVDCPLSQSDLTSGSRKEMKAVRRAPISFLVNHHDRQVVRRLREPPHETALLSPFIIYVGHKSPNPKEKYRKIYKILLSHEKNSRRRELCCYDESRQ